MRFPLLSAGVVLLLLGCGGADSTGPGTNASLELTGFGGPLEAETSRLLNATWRDARGTYAASGVTWRSSDQGVAKVDPSGNVTGVTPGTVAITAEAAGRSAVLALEVVPLTHYSPQELAVFNHLVFSGNGARRLRKWAGGIQIQLSGAPTPEDRALVDQVAGELAAALRTIPLTVVEFGGNVQLAFVPDTLYARMAGGMCAPPAFVWGFSCPTADSDSRYIQTLVFVSSIRDAGVRRYLVRHELMHMVGFYDHPAEVASMLTRPEQLALDHYQPLDLTLFEMMGRAELTAGMFGSDAMLVLGGLTRLASP